MAFVGIHTTKSAGKLAAGLYMFAYRVITKQGGVSNWSSVTKEQMLLTQKGTKVIGPEYINEITNYQDMPYSNEGFQVKIDLTDLDKDATNLTTDLKDVITHVELLRMT
jgi:hypothetical protein